MARDGSKHAANFVQVKSVSCGGAELHAKNVRAIVSKTATVVAKIPGIVAYNDLLERILDHGVVLDGESQLAAMAAGRTNLSATAKPGHLVLSSGDGIKGVSLRRRGAPLSGAAIRPKS
jgi:hypothetical protein